MGKYTNLLEKEFNDLNECSDKKITKSKYLGDSIFDFVTYDDNMTNLFVNKMIQVLESILEQKTYDYINESEDNYLNYLTMVNMPFLAEKIDWSTSIRGAWFDKLKEYEVDCSKIIIEKQEIKIFIKELIDWIES
jgi:hypothetical protein